MIYDGIRLIEGSTIQNPVIASGTAFPANPDTGELFMRTDTGAAGLYVYEDATWKRMVKDGETTGGSLSVGTSGAIQLSDGAGAFSTQDGFSWVTSTKQLSATTAFTINPAPQTAGAVGRALTVRGGAGGPASTGGQGALISISGGAGGTGTTGAGGAGGELRLSGGNAGSGNFGQNGGAVNIYGGLAHSSGTGGTIALFTGNTSSTERLRIISNGAWGLGGANYGTSGQVLTSQGPSSPPIWSSASAGVTIDTNQTITGDKTFQNATTVFSRTDNGPAFTRFESSTTAQYLAGGLSVGLTNASQTNARYTQIYHFNATTDGTSTGFAIAQANSSNAFVNPIFTFNYGTQLLQLFSNGTQGLSINSTQRVVIGSSSAIADHISNQNRLQVIGSTGADSRIITAAYGNDSTGPALILMKSRSSTVGTGNNATLSGDSTGSIVFVATNGSAVVRNASIGAFAESNGTAGAGVPGFLTFNTAPASAPNTLPERMRIDSTGRVMIGLTQPVTESFSAQAAFSVGSTEVQLARMCLSLFRNDGVSPAFTFVKSRGTTAGSQGIVQNGDMIGLIPFEASNGINLARAAAVSVTVDGSPSTSSMPAQINFQTTPSGSNTPVTRLSIRSSGAWQVDGQNGSSGQVLTSNGAASSPTWQNLPSVNLQSSSSSLAIGYTTGAGSTVTQPTSKETSVTINRPTGRINTAGSVINDSETLYFTVFNSVVTANSVVYANLLELGQNFEVSVGESGNGYFTVRMKNIDNAPSNAVLQIKFVVLNGASA